MNIGYFGGTFDPIHRGHLAVARAVARNCKLQQVLFVPTDVPPHKYDVNITPFIHRYTMTALALAEAHDKRFLPSLLEAPIAGGGPRYSIDTVRRLKQTLGARDRLFFIIGVDAFLDIAKWRQPEELLRECEFVVASRPGYSHSLAELATALPKSMQSARARGNKLTPPGVTIHFVAGIASPISATAVRTALEHAAWQRVRLRGSKKLEQMLPRSVADYIRKMHLYEVE